MNSNEWIDKEAKKIGKKAVSDDYVEDGGYIRDWLVSDIAAFARRVRAESLEEAANLSNNFTACNHGENCPKSECDCPTDICFAIRALAKEGDGV